MGSPRASSIMSRSTVSTAGLAESTSPAGRPRGAGTTPRTGLACAGWRDGERASSIDDETPHVVPLELLTPVQKRQLREDADSRNLGAEALDQIGGGADRAAGGKKVVDDQYTHAGLDGVAVDLDSVGPVFECVFLAQGRRR